MQRLNSFSHHLSRNSVASFESNTEKKSVDVFNDPQATSVDLRAGPLFNMSGKICLVTGGSKGIGKMIATAYVVNGAKVYICSRKASLCDEVSDKLNKEYSSTTGGVAESLPGDLSTLSGVLKVVEELKKRTDKLHVLVNNAGATRGAPLEDFPDKAWETVMDLNVRHVFNLTQQLLPLLRRGATAIGDPARVIMIASVEGVRATLTNGPTAAFSYTASKGALVHLTKALSRSFSKEDFNITVNCIAPGIFPSNMTKFMLNNSSFKETVEEDNPMKRVGRTADMAATVLYLSSIGGGFTNGAVIVVDGGQYVI